MKNLLAITFLVLISSVAASAQTAQPSLCPAISVIGENYPPIPSEPYTFTATVGKEVENYKVEYKWTVSNGEIIEGQGTLAAKVLLRDAAYYGSLLVNFEVLGLPKDCPNYASESVIVDELPVQASLIEEVSISQIKKAKSFERPNVLDEDPYAQLYILFRYKKNTAPKTIKRTEQKIFDSLIKAEIKKDRITLVKGSASVESIQFWLVPAGASAPAIED